MAIPVVSVADVIVTESAGYAEFVFRLDAPSSEAVSVIYQSMNGSADGQGWGNDFVLTGGQTLTFAPTVTLDRPSTSPVSLTYQTAKRTAVAGTDYQALAADGRGLHMRRNNLVLPMDPLLGADWYSLSSKWQPFLHQKYLATR